MSQELPHEVAESLVNRFTANCDTLRQLDSGDYPLAFYSSGETQIRHNAKGQILVDKDHHPLTEPVALPVYGKLPSDTHCLRFAVCQAIYSDLGLFIEMGGGDDALDIINSRRLFPKKGTVYQSKP